MRGLIRTLLLTLAAAVASVAGGDASPPQATAPPPAPRPSPSPSPSASPSPAGDIEDFVPTEKVSTDEAVAFPVDI